MCSDKVEICNRNMNRQGSSKEESRVNSLIGEEFTNRWVSKDTTETYKLDNKGQISKHETGGSFLKRNQKSTKEGTR